jgi:hypothetical protein
MDGPSDDPPPATRSIPEQVSIAANTSSARSSPTSLAPSDTPVTSGISPITVRKTDDPATENYKGRSPPVPIPEQPRPNGSFAQHSRRVEDKAGLAEWDCCLNRVVDAQTGKFYQHVDEISIFALGTSLQFSLGISTCHSSAPSTIRISLPTFLRCPSAAVIPFTH